MPSPRRWCWPTAARVKYIKLFDGGMVDNYGLSGHHHPARRGDARPTGRCGRRKRSTCAASCSWWSTPGSGPKGNWSTDAGRPRRQGTGRRGVRRHHRRQRACELCRLRGDHAELARRDRALALRAQAGRGGAAARRPRRALELPRPEDHRRRALPSRRWTPRAPSSSTRCRPRSRCRRRRSTSWRRPAATRSRPIRSIGSF